MTKGLKLQAEVRAVTVAGDEEKLGTVVDNLLSNAVKYSPPGGVIRITLQEAAAGAVLDVSDSGPGIEAADREQVFEAFYQGAAAREGHVQGTGLGLSIAREYVLAHKGTIEIVKDAVPGTHVRVTLPPDVLERAK
jgi:two-component system sensor histidine kinase GlrK